jgi:pentatricopeptide repeat protein
VRTSETEALEVIRGYAKAHRIEYSRHALRRMRERNINEQAIRHALVTAQKCILQENECWKVPSFDFSGCELTVVLAIEDDLLVVTVF